MTGPGLRTSLVRFVVVGGLSLAVDFVVLFTLHSLAHVALWLATGLGYATSLVVTYVLSHSWVFESHEEHRKAVVRYAGLVAVSLGATIGVVVGLTGLGAFYLVAKLVSAAVNAAINFVGFRWWVFR